MSFTKILTIMFAALLSATASADLSVSRIGGTADWMCCADQACSSVLSQHADEFRAAAACANLSRKDGVARYLRSQTFRVVESAPPVTPPVVPPVVPPATGTRTATVNWLAPTTNTDGSPISPLVGYRIHYGTTSSLGQIVNVTELPLACKPTSKGVECSRTIDGLAVGSTYYFAMTARTATEESSRTNLVSVTVQ